ncbi:MAG: flagellin [Myxococcota bacterium]
MAIGINTNVMSLNSQRQLMKTQGMLSTSMERLSSGLRINSAKDDAAGLAISNRMSSQIRGLNQATRNANDAISLSQTAEGSLQEATSMLQRMRDLAVQSSNDTNSATDRANLQKEVSQLQQEIDRIAQTTRFNGKSLLDGTFTAQVFQIGAFANESISVSINNAQSSSMGANAVSASGTLSNAVAANATPPAANTVTAAEDLTITGSLGSSTIDVAAGATARAIASQVNGASAGTGVEATAITQATFGTLSAAGTVAFTLQGQGSAAVSATVASASDLTDLASSINSVASTTGVTAELSSDRGSLTLVSREGYDIGIDNFTVAANVTASVQGLDASGANSGAAVTLTSGTTDSTRVGGALSFTSAEAFSVTSAAAGGLFTGTTANASSLSAVSSIDIGTQAGADSALAVIDSAIQFIDNQRADIGAIQNRLESTISNLTNVSENVTAARARIQDADFAAETAQLTKAQILQQAGTAMLAQANQMPQIALSLLG